MEDKKSLAQSILATVSQEPDGVELQSLWARASLAYRSPA
ncbi:hypothetical protein PS726_00150 [Pseudomonas fluorescens]|nr:hypothetical protein PS726_00150 [Pseudomonas fluorescens]